MNSATCWGCHALFMRKKEMTARPYYGYATAIEPLREWH